MFVTSFKTPWLPSTIHFTCPGGIHCATQHIQRQLPVTQIIMQTSLQNILRSLKSYGIYSTYQTLSVPCFSIHRCLWAGAGLKVSASPGPDQTLSVQCCSVHRCLWAGAGLCMFRPPLWPSAEGVRLPRPRLRSSSPCCCGVLPRLSYHWLQNWNSSGYPVRCPCLQVWLVRCQYIVTGWDKFDLQLVSVWQHVQLSKQICPQDTLACCWDDKWRQWSWCLLHIVKSVKTVKTVIMVSSSYCQVSEKKISEDSDHGVFFLLSSQWKQWRKW